MIGAVRVLVVDPDGEAIAGGIEGADERFDVASVGSIAEALDRFEGGRVDAVLCATDLPDGTAPDVIERVRAHHPDLPVVVYARSGSAAERERSATEALDAGATDVTPELDAEWQPSVLAHRLLSLVERYRSRQIVDETLGSWTELEERIDDIYFMFDGTWSELLYINEAFETMWGGSIERLQAEPQSFLELVHPEDREIAVGSMEQLSAGEPSDVQYRVRPPDGEVRWVRGIAVPLTDDDGHVVRIAGTVRNVTDVKEREQRFEAIFQEAFDAMVLADDDGRYVQVNDAACELFGLEREDLLGRAIDEFAPEDVDVDSQWAEFQATGHARGRFPIERPDGEVRTVEFAATRDVVPGEHLSILRDVTDQEHQRAELERSEARYETLIEDVIDTSDVGTIILDQDLEVVWINRAVESFFGLDRGAAVGTPEPDLVATEMSAVLANPDAFTERVLASYEDGTYIDHLECRIPASDGRPGRWLEYWSRPIESGLYAGGRIEHFADSTDTKERDRQLQVLARVLRHNLHNKMNLVLGFAETIADEAGPPHAERAAQIAETSRDLLALTDTQKHIVDLVTAAPEVERVDLQQTVTGAVERIRAEFPHARVAVDCPDDLTVLAVPHIQNCVVELLENAIVHSDAAEPSVDVFVVEADDEAVVHVVDKNDPIPDLETAILRGDAEIGQLTHSRGLGLWLVNWLVETSGGSVAFDGSPERGNVVRFTLPLVEDAATGRLAE